MNSLPGNPSPSSRDLTRAFEFAVAADESTGSQIGRYKLLEKIGEGGFGEVWLAEQVEPVRRRVALKVIKAGMDTRELLARFEAERQALALMEHPNIARVFDAGATGGGRPYFVMEFVPGVPITQYCDSARLPTAQRLALFISVCLGVQHAHHKGIIHRDLKPSNILITQPDGEPVPKIIDFGIAKAISAAPLTQKTLFTRLHTFIGTPLYTSPEQLDATGTDIDTRSDVYSLGVLLYELLTGRLPFDSRELVEAGLDEMRRRIRETDPLRPSTGLSTLEGDALAAIAGRRRAAPPDLIRQVRGDLDWIVMRCLDKDRARRYPTATALADDVQRHLHDEPVEARPPTRLYRFKKLVRRNRLVFILGSAIAMTLLVGAVVASWQAIRASHAEQVALRAGAAQTRLRQLAEDARGKEAAARAQAEAERQRADAGELAAMRHAYAADMQFMQLALSWGDLDYARDLLHQHRPVGAAGPDFRDWEWRYRWRELASDLTAHLAEGLALSKIHVSTDGQWIAGIQRQPQRNRGAILVWNLRSRQQRALPSVPLVNFNTPMSFTPDAPVLAVVMDKLEGSTAGSWLQLWNVATGALVREWQLDFPCRALQFSVNGEKILAALNHGNRHYHLHIWRTRDGRLLETIPLPPDPPAAPNRTQIWLAVDRDWRHAAICSQELLQVVDLPSGQQRWELPGFYANALTFSPDGEILAAAVFNDHGVVRLWNARSGTPAGELRGHHRPLNDHGLVFWPDSRRVATSAADYTIRVWDVQSCTATQTLVGTAANVGSLALLPDGKTLVSSGGPSGKISLCDVSVSPAGRGYVKLGTGFAAWCFSPDSTSVLTVDASGTVIRWSGRDWRNRDVRMKVGELTRGFDLRRLVDIAAERPLVAVSRPDGKVDIWNWEQRSLLHTLQASTTETLIAGFTADGSKVLLNCRNEAASDYVLSVWDVQTGSLSGTVGPYGGRIGLSRSPDGRHLIAHGMDRYAVLDPIHGTEKNSVRWPTAAKEVTSFKDGIVTDGAVSPDGSLLAIRGAHSISIFDLRALDRVATLNGPSNMITFSPNGRRLVGTAFLEQSLAFYDVAGGNRVLHLSTPEARISYPKFSPDGNIIGVMSLLAGDLFLWRAPTWNEIEAADAAAGKTTTAIVGK